jgi:hypothetical protein
MNTRAPFQFGISTLLWLTTWVAVVMSVSVTVPGGIVLMVVLVPPLLRTILYVRRKRGSGKFVSVGERIAVFIAFFFISLSIATVAAVTMLIASQAISGGGGLFSIPTGRLTAGDIAGICIAVLLWVHLLGKWFRSTHFERADEPLPQSTAAKSSPRSTTESNPLCQERTIDLPEKDE